MNKIGAMVRYEVLMAWRRRSLPILWFLLLVGVVGFALLVSSVNQQGMSLAQIMARNSNMPTYVLNTIPLINILVAGVLIFSVGITLMIVETFPLDKQFKVRELLDTLPINRSVYIGGKVLGAWSGLLIGWVLMGIVCSIALYLILGAYDLRVLVLLWVVALLPATLLASALSVLAGALVGSRRLAVLVGLVLLPITLFLVGWGIPAFFNTGGLIDPIYAMAMAGPVTPTRLLNDLLIVIAGYTGVIAGVWVIVWGWMRVRER
jgi:hypothetical protein